MIPTQLSSAYTTVAHNLRSLKERVDSILKAFAEEQDGQYSSRVKTIDSVFDKAVLGNYRQLDEIEDLFAATVILPTAPIGEGLNDFTQSLSGHFTVLEVRSNRTRRPSEFIYDDLHYVLRLKDSALLLNKSLLVFSFELQVKSYLQHGWAKATHNTIYKAHNESWRASRVAAQTKAAVEMIEAALATGESLLPNEAEQRYTPIDDRVAILGLLLEWWHGDFPENRRRLGMFALNALKRANCSLDDFKRLLSSRRGELLQKLLSLSIQQAILILLIENFFDSIVLSAQKGDLQYLLITREMEDFSEKCREVPFEIRFRLAGDRCEDIHQLAADGQAATH
ncbi:MAG: RelA/SpoT domain-containing protein [Desulfurivibrionaceae bacterium]|jgi:ppGpp synthetase/RelA/SpoT-type nucleotidyltranferase